MFARPFSLINPPEPAINYPQIFKDLALLPPGHYELQSTQPWWKVWDAPTAGWVKVSVNDLGCTTLLLTRYANEHWPFVKRHFLRFDHLGEFMSYRAGHSQAMPLIWHANYHDAQTFEIAAQRAAWIWQHLDRQGLFDPK